MLADRCKPVAAIATTPAGAIRLAPLAQIPGVTLWLPASLAEQVSFINEAMGQSLPTDRIQSYSGSLKQHIADLWPEHRSFVFALATGAVVRLIAPLLADKATDPAVVVVDEAGECVISLLGGHQGGADQLAWAIAPLLNTTPILTGASNHLQLPGIDVLGLPFGWQRGSGDWTTVSSAIAHGTPVQVIQTTGSTLWQQHLPTEHPFVWEGAEETIGARVYITEKVMSDEWTVDSGKPPVTSELLPTDTPSLPTPPLPHSSLITHHSPLPTCYWHPRVLWIGIGCERGTPRAVIESAVQQVLATQQLAMAAIAGIATLDWKADEQGLLEFCQAWQLPLQCFAAAQLRTVTVPTPSAIVEAEVGTPSVAEAAALYAAIPHSLTHPPTLLIPKQIHRLPNHPGAVTVAVVQAEREYIDRVGQLWLVGTGPGALAQITPAAQAAIAQADVVIGYSLYIDLIRPLLRPGQIVEALPITQEKQRAERAIALADWGLTVAVISSGDCGIYGMAGLVFEALVAQGWDGQVPDVQVFPGITALQAAASRVGAPLMHDFCAISLSDLLTPWELIERRLHAAAQGDFVTAFYNPRSQKRVEQLDIAQQIFLQYRSADTPVALVRSAYRPDEQITLTTLGELQTCVIDMLTVVLIGNGSTSTHEDWMITPRGYVVQAKG